MTDVFERTETGQFAASVDENELPAWIELRTKGELSIRDAAERMGVSRRTGGRYESRWRRKEGGLAAEFIHEPQPDGARGFWVAYPNKDTILELEDARDRVSLAWGRGPDREAALVDAWRRGHRELNDPASFRFIPDAVVTGLGVFAPWDFGASKHPSSDGCFMYAW